MTAIAGHLLIVDDNAVDRERIRRFLGGAFATREAATAAEALALSIEGELDCVLLDYRLPDRDGIDLIDQLGPGELPVIMLTGQGDEHVAVEAMKRGACDYLVKSLIDAGSLRRAVENAIDKQRLQRRIRAQQAELEARLRELARRGAELEAANLALSEREARLRAILKQLPAVVWTASDDLRYTSMSGLHRVAGLADDEMVGREVGHFLDDAERAEHEEAHRAALEGAPVPFELRWNARALEGSLEPLRDEGGRVLGAIGAALDVTDTRQLQHQLQRSQKMEALGKLAGGVAHDFNNILTIVRANAEVAAAGAPTEIAPALADIEEAAARAGGLCKQLLDYAGGSVRRPEAVRLDELALDVRRMLRGGIPKKVTLDAGVDEAWVLADRQQMQQVVMNLVINAAEAIGAREGRVGLRVRVLPAEAVALERAYLAPEEVPARWVSLEVEDDGEGMDEATTRRVFDPFFTTKEHGRGLGLAALLGIVRAHGGALLVESRKGAGTRFTVLLPEGHPSDQEASEAPAGPAADKTVLIAEDEPAVREVASAALRRAGFRVHAAADGREALALFLAREAEIDAVLLDVDMPGVDGREALEAIRARRPDVAAVVTSGLGEARAPEGEHAVFLAKPYDGRQLLAALGRAIESRAAPPN